MAEENSLAVVGTRMSFEAVAACSCNRWVVNEHRNSPLDRHTCCQELHATLPLFRKGRWG